GVRRAAWVRGGERGGAFDQRDQRDGDRGGVILGPAGGGRRDESSHPPAPRAVVGAVYGGQLRIADRGGPEADPDSALGGALRVQREPLPQYGTQRGPW